MTAAAPRARPTPPVPAGTGHRILDAAAVDRCCWRLAHELQERRPALEAVVLCGIRSRGVPLALRLAEAVRRQGARPPQVASLDVGPYRDDRRRRLTTSPPAPAPGLDRRAVEGRVVVLVDDVLFHGRTARAALQAVHQLGRPEAVELLVLVDRGHRQLPLRATYVGRNLPTREAEHVAVRLRELDGEDGVDLLGSEPAR